MNENKNSSKIKYEFLRNVMLDFIKTNNLKRNDQLPTVREIMSNSGYSYSTVSRTLIEMEKEGIISKHQGKGIFVEKTPDELRDRQFALIIPFDDPPNKIYNDILSGVKEVLERETIGLMVRISNMSHEKEKSLIENLASQNVDGLIIFLEDNYTKDYSHLITLQKRKTPFVLIDRFIPELETDYVIINNRDAMLRVCSYLKYKKDCDKIVFIPSSDDDISTSSSKEKLLGYKTAMRSLYGTGFSEIVALSELAENITELGQSNKNVGLCFNHDALIVELKRLLSEKNVRIPENCHIFGYNHNFDPPLFPTVEQFNKKVGIRAAEILINKIQNPNAPIVHEYIEPKLILPDGNGGFCYED